MVTSLLPSFLLLATTSFSLSQPNYSPTQCMFSASTGQSSCARFSLSSMDSWVSLGQVLIPGPPRRDQGSMTTWFKACKLRNFKVGAVMDIQRHLRRGQNNWQALCMPVWCICNGHPATTFVRKILVSIFSLQEQQREPLRFHLIIMCFSEKQIAQTQAHFRLSIFYKHPGAQRQCWKIDMVLWQWIDCSSRDL